MTNDNDTAAPSTIAHSIHGSGPTLVLIHGICHSRHAWDDVLPGLVDHFRVVAIDLPGHGETPDPDSLDDEVGERMIDELAEFLRHVSVDGEKPHVAGNSLGGYLALELAGAGTRRRRPHSIRPGSSTARGISGARWRSSSGCAPSAGR